MTFRASLTCLFLVPCLLGQGTERLTLESIAHPTLKKTYVGAPSTRLEWLADGSLMQTRREGDQVALLRLNPTTWESRPLIEAAPLQAALVAAGATEAEARELKVLIDKSRDWRRNIYSEKAVLTAKATGIYNLMAEIQFLEKSMFGNLSEGVAANLRFAHAMRKIR